MRWGGAGQFAGGGECGVACHALGEPPPGRHHPLRGVDPERPGEAVAVGVHRQPLAIGNAAGHHLDLVVRAGVTEELDAVIELIAPKERQRRVWGGLVAGGDRQCRLGGVGALFDGIRPVLDAHGATELRQVPTHDVACRVHPWDGRTVRVEHAQRRVTDDSVVEGDTRADEPVGCRRGTDTDDDHVRLDEITGGARA